MVFTIQEDTPSEQLRFRQGARVRKNGGLYDFNVLE